MAKKPKIESVIRSFEQFKNYCVDWSDHDWENDPRSVISKRHVKDKSNPQNATIHGLIRRLSTHTGDDFEYLMEAFKEAYGPKTLMKMHIATTVNDRESGGDFMWVDKDVEVPKSIADYNQEEASNMIETILYLASDHYGVYLEIEG